MQLLCQTRQNFKFSQKTLKIIEIHDIHEDFGCLDVGILCCNMIQNDVAFCPQCDILPQGQETS